MYHVRLLRRSALVESCHHRKLLQIDVAVWAPFDAGSAADAPVFNNHLEGTFAADGSHRAPDHAERVATLPAGSRNKETVETQTVADQPCDPLVRVCAGFHALIAARAAVQVKHQQALRLH